MRASLLAAVALTVIATPALAAGFKMLSPKSNLLPVDQAFGLLPAERRGKTVHVEWNIAPGYFLYGKRLHIDLVGPAGVSLGKAALPAGEMHDSGDGPEVVYRGILAADLPVSGTRAGALKLRLRYQGCADAGVCYPPQDREVEAP